MVEEEPTHQRGIREYIVGGWTAMTRAQVIVGYSPLLSVALII